MQANRRRSFDIVPFTIPKMGGIANLLNTIAWLTTFFLICMIRQKIRMRDEIQETMCRPHDPCAGCEDCCCSWWCTPCTICQLMRHELHPDPMQYRFGSPTAV